MVVIDSRADRRVLDAVGEYIGLPASLTTDNRLSGHVDLRMVKIDDTLVVCPDDYDFMLSAVGAKCHIVCGLYQPSALYAGDIPYNALCVSDMLFCLSEHTDPVVLQTAEACGKKIINVRQGYAKCSGIPVGGCGVITSDQSIARAAEREGLQVLHVSNRGVALDGYDTGFIGGASICFKNRILFTGDLSVHPDFLLISDFCKKLGVELEYIKGMKLYDYGSPIALF